MGFTLCKVKHDLHGTQSTQISTAKDTTGRRHSCDNKARPGMAGVAQDKRRGRYCIRRQLMVHKARELVRAKDTTDRRHSHDNKAIILISRCGCLKNQLQRLLHNTVMAKVATHNNT